MSIIMITIFYTKKFDKAEESNFKHIAHGIKLLNMEIIHSLHSQ